MCHCFRVWLLLSLALLAGCASAPKTFNYDPTLALAADYETVWGAVVEYFAITNLPIDTIEKDSGLIVTSWMDASQHGIGTEDKTYCDCGGAGMATQNWTRGKFNVYVTRSTSGAQIRVTCLFQQSREYFGTNQNINCNSTGYLEKLVQDYVRAKTEGKPLPSVRPFSLPRVT